ncbi:hypothetical protein ACB092_05G203200 [Castanea dentata]
MSWTYFLTMLVLSFVLGHLLRCHKFYYLPEASVSLLPSQGSVSHLYALSTFNLDVCECTRTMPRTDSLIKP